METGANVAFRAVSAWIVDNRIPLGMLFAFQGPEDEEFSCSDVIHPLKLYWIDL